MGTEEFPATPTGYRDLLAWLRGHGELIAVGVEGTGAWGAGLARFLAAEGVAVVEVQRPNRQHRRRHGKSDPADAVGAARAVQAEEVSGAPKAATGNVECIRLLQIARRSAMKARTQAANQMHAVVTTAPEQLRSDLEDLDTTALAKRASRFGPGDPATPTAAARRTLRILGRRWLALSADIDELDNDLDQLTATTAPTLGSLPSVGPQNASALLIAAGDNPDRLCTEASYAARPARKSCAA